eukprot:6459571-Amphidinium_carterae.1
MFTEERQAKVYQARTGTFLTRETFPWNCICGWYESTGARKFQVDMGYGYFRITHSKPEKVTGGKTEEPLVAHSGGSETKKEEPSTPKEVPRADAGAENDTTAEPFEWEARDRLSVPVSRLQPPGLTLQIMGPGVAGCPDSHPSLPNKAGSSNLVLHIAGCPDNHPSLPKKAGSPDLVLHIVVQTKRAGTGHVASIMDTASASGAGDSGFKSRWHPKTSRGRDRWTGKSST